jgi:hypothetical protein
MLPKPVVKVRMYYVYQVNQKGPRRMDCCTPKGGSTDEFRVSPPSVEQDMGP